MAGGSNHIALNLIMDSDFDSVFANNILATIREAFGSVWTTNVKNVKSDISNITVTNWPIDGSVAWNGSGKIYRDDKNSADRDHVAMLWAPGQN